LSTSCISAPKTWKPGGVVVLAILGPWSQLISKVYHDDLGRWASATLTGSDGESFTIFSFNNVVDVALSAAGPSTIFSQQYRLLRLAGATYPNPRQQCIQDLNREVAKLRANHDIVLVMGNFNETLGWNPRLMAQVCANNDLYDELFQSHGENAMIPTYARGTNQLDYCIVSLELAPMITACGYNL
jgi:hypothetical protein